MDILYNCDVKNIYLISFQFKVESDLKNLGFLDPGSDNPDLMRGSKMELPFWMVEGLRSNQEKMLIFKFFLG